ncbi:MAG: FAD-binding oxidoreductase [Acidiferrobacterales bacterium]|nr:FAD-binding oxidoreductase [Acidiferrobacterales bacterium]
MASAKKFLAGWGRYPVQECITWRPERASGLYLPTPMISRGQGRSYGDAALNENGNVVLTERVNRFLDFDSDSGELRAEAGVTLAEIIDVCLPRGWFLPVTPGTKFVSLGGCIAADVHGKNHHRDGAFSSAVESFSLIVADGTVLNCSRNENSDVFWATVGGMGLTGAIKDVSLRLRPVETARVIAKHQKAQDLEQAFTLLAEEDDSNEYTVAWIDCLARGRSLGRSVVMHGRHATAEELPASKSVLATGGRKVRTLPIDLPSFALNSVSVSLFNAIYYRREGGKQKSFVTDIDRYFYPLDSIHHWNRLYGKRGFVQYQCVLPINTIDTAFEGIKRILEQLSASRRASFLAVLKRLGPESGGLLSFPQSGYTLALDLPVRGKDLFAMLDRLDDIVVKAGGRVYLAKDARLGRDSFEAMYPRLSEWREVKQRIDPNNHFDSSMARRLGLTNE